MATCGKLGEDLLIELAPDQFGNPGVETGVRAARVLARFQRAPHAPADPDGPRAQVRRQMRGSRNRGKIARGPILGGSFGEKIREQRAAARFAAHREFGRTHVTEEFRRGHVEVRDAGGFKRVAP